MGSTYGEPFADWPIGYEDLEPYYDRVEWEMGVCGPDGLRPYDGPPPRLPDAAAAAQRRRSPCSSAAPGRSGWQRPRCRC